VHKGFDISAHDGEPVHAAPMASCSPRIRRRVRECMLVDHGKRVATFYAHNSRLAVEIGKRVRAGDVIAYAGSTGVATGSHVHFEVRLNGQAVDPAPYLGL
jgi:Peptidase family M23